MIHRLRTEEDGCREMWAEWQRFGRGLKWAVAVELLAGMFLLALMALAWR